MLRSLKFSKPKGPGFGISKNYYLSVLSTHPTMPALWDLINPSGEQGAVVGFGAPLMAGATKDTLRMPMQRGAYALAMKDRKTVLKLLVLNKEEAAFDPEVLVRSRLAAVLSPQMAATIRATWILGQLTFESHDPNVYPALAFHLAIARRLAELTDGAIADPLSQRYLFPTEVLRHGTNDVALNVADLMSIGTANRPDGTHVFTLGMQKLALPEIEIAGIDPAVVGLAGEFLAAVGQSVVQGSLLTPSAKVGANGALFDAQVGGHDRSLWEGVPVMELLPPRQMTATDALEIWDRERSKLVR